MKGMILGNDASKIYSNTSMLFFTMILQSTASATVTVKKIENLKVFYC